MPSTSEPDRGSSSSSAAPIDAALIEEWALSYLTRYASSAENLRRVLMRRARRRLARANERDPQARGSADASIDALVARYRAARLLDDAAYAAGRARRDLARGRSLRRIAAGLAAKGVGAADAAAAITLLRETNDNADLVAACAFARRRRLGPYRTIPPAPPAERERELAAFARAGFTRHTAEAVLACPDAVALAALLADQS